MIAKPIISDAPNAYPPWAPRIWNGFLLPQYLSFLAENRFSIHPTRYPMTSLVGMCSVVNTLFAGIQKLAYSSKIQSQTIEQPPVFIVGHWRSGTTLLHELMSLDPNLAFPNNYDSFVPNHFLCSAPLVRPLFKALLPSKRPMDNMTVAADSPQEDDFALMILGAASHYRRMGFPQGRNEYGKWLDAANLTDEQRNKVRDCLTYFYKALTYKYQKRLVLKSPPHTGRIKYLSQWFPGAKFIHISRHPYSIVPSTMRLWMISDDVHAFQLRRYSQSELVEYVNRCQRYLYEAYFRDRAAIADNQIVEIKFEDLTTKPSDTIRTVYEKLELGDNQSVVQAAEQYFQQKRDHKKNQFDLDAYTDVIDSQWQDYISAFYH